MVKEVPFQYTPTGKTIKLGRIQHEPIPYSFRRDVIGRDPARFRAFVRKLSESPRISAGELVLFMNGFGLRFGVADGAAGREAYARLQAQLSSVREAVMKRPGEPEGARGPVNAPEAPIDVGRLARPGTRRRSRPGIADRARAVTRGGGPTHDPVLHQLSEQK
ncbi:MAG: hypothetical protein U0790_03865 [Isosphaeraceae bacterium]